MKLHVSLMIALQATMMIGPVKVDFQIESVAITQGADITVALNGFGADDMIEVRQVNAVPYVTVLSAPVAGRKIINKTKAFALNQSGNTLTFSPAKDGYQGRIIMILVPQVPTKVPIHVTQNRAALPFIKETLFIEGSHTSQDQIEFSRRMVDRFGRPQ